MKNEELKTKIQQLIDQKERQSKHFLNVFIQQMEEIGTLKRLRDLEGEELLMCLGWLSIKHNRHRLTSKIKENLLETIEKEVSLIEKSNSCIQYLTNQEITIELEKRLNNNALTDNERMSLIRILLKINQKPPQFT